MIFFLDESGILIVGTRGQKVVQPSFWLECQILLTLI